MNELASIFIVLVLLGGEKFEEAPPETVDAVASLHRLASVFQNCDFSAVQTFKETDADGSRYVAVCRSSGKACPDAVVVHSERIVKDQVTSTGEKLHDWTTYEERRWLRGQPRFDLELASVESVNRQGIKWLLENSSARNGVSIVNVKQSPELPRDPAYVWTPLVVAAFLDKAYAAGGPFADLVAGDQPWGYKLASVKWLSPERSTGIIYHYVSSDYGEMMITFSKLGEWKPTRIQLIKLANHIVDPTLTAPRNRLKDYQEFVGFSQPTTGLERLDTVYTIMYSPTAAGPELPKEIDCVETRLWKGEKSVIDIALTFDKLNSGNVRCDEVTASMLRIPDGTKAFMVRTPGLDKLDWMTKDGKVVKKTSIEAINLGREARFTSARKFSTIVTSIVVAVLTALILYRRFYLSGN